MGIDRTYAKINEADIVLWLIDLTAYKEQFETLAQCILPAAVGKQLVILLNKQDLVDSTTLSQATHYLNQKISTPSPTLLSMSAQSAEGLEQLHQILVCTLSKLKTTTAPNGTIVSNLRHYEALSAALVAIDRVSEGLAQGLSGDFISQDLRECIYHLNDIAGEVTTDEVLGNIFKHFCIGK